MTNASAIFATLAIGACCAALAAPAGTSSAGPGKAVATAQLPSVLTASAPGPGVAQTPGAEGSASPAAPRSAEPAAPSGTLNAEASLIMAGIPEGPAPAPAQATPAAGGRTFYVDSRSGDDRNDGRAAMQSAAGTRTAGPWRSLSRVMQSDLGPGDLLVLACGSSWAETLRVPASGTADRPVTVTAPPAGCGNLAPPTIDGSIAISPAAWTKRSGSVYVTTLPSAPLQLFAANGVMMEAHHPNVGHDTAAPGSLFVAMAGDGDTLTADGRVRSRSIITGNDLVLPAGAQLSPGTRVRIRTNSWSVEERAISAVDGSKLTLDAHTFYPALKGWGYFLVGQAWMVDSPGEWHYDGVTRLLTAWMPDGLAPTQAVHASALATAADFTRQSYVALNGLALQRTGAGIVLRGTVGMRVSNMIVQDIAGVAVDLGGSNAATIESSLFLRIGQDAITGVPGGTADARGMIVRKNVIRESGVLLSGGIAAGLPRKSNAAIYAGPDATVSDNAIQYSGYIGIRFMPRSRVQGNSIIGACMVLDDCGGIYTWGKAANNSVVEGNIVVRLPGNRDGKPRTAGTHTIGIYLDDQTTGVTVEANTAADADHGIQVHDARENRILQNVLYGYRRSGIWLQDDTNTASPDGDVSNNVIVGNQIASVFPGAVALLLDSRFASTRAFARFDRNRYLDRSNASLVQERTPAGQRSLTLQQWRSSDGIGSITPPDATATGTSDGSPAVFRVEGKSLVPKELVTTGPAAWAQWNKAAPQGRLVVADCEPGRCLRYVPGGSSGLLSSPNFSVVRGRWYRLTLDLLPEAQRQTIQLRVRRGGGGTNGYESLSDRDLTFQAASGWHRYSTVFQATNTVNFRDPATGDNGARVDFEGLVPGASLTVANVELVPVAPAAERISTLVVNAGAKTHSVDCPFTGSATGQCARARLLREGQAVNWPLVLRPMTSEVVWVVPMGPEDRDRDGIADSDDSCPATPVRAVVNARGCALPDR